MYIYIKTAAGSSIISQLGSFCQDNRYDTEKAGGTARLSHTKLRTCRVTMAPASQAGRLVGPAL
jgi:hypothetical protein